MVPAGSITVKNKTCCHFKKCDAIALVIQVNPAFLFFVVEFAFCYR